MRAHSRDARARLQCARIVHPLFPAVEHRDHILTFMMPFERVLATNS
jgi:hypothetical protein